MVKGAGESLASLDRRRESVKGNLVVVLFKLLAHQHLQLESANVSGFISLLRRVHRKNKLTNGSIGFARALRKDRGSSRTSGRNTRKTSIRGTIGIIKLIITRFFFVLKQNWKNTIKTKKPDLPAAAGQPSGHRPIPCPWRRLHRRRRRLRGLAPHWTLCCASNGRC